MKTPKFFTVIIAATFGLVASTFSAFAVPATATSAVNVRSGPSTAYTILDTLHTGQAVNVTQCQGGWCYVEKPGPDGWVSGNYLQAAQGGNNNGNSAADDAAAAAAIQIFGTIAGAVVGNIVAPPPPPPPQICFFDGINYAGASICVAAGTTNNQLVGIWNNSISSITVPAGSSATVCRNWNYGGTCRTYNADIALIHPIVNNQVSSFQTF